MVEILVGLDVTDNESYRAYRDAMTPLLHKVGGYFRYDFTIDQALKSETSEPINRLFIIGFPDTATQERFFNDAEYLAIKTKYFENAVAATTIITEYQRNS